MKAKKHIEVMDVKHGRVKWPCVQVGRQFAIHRGYYSKGKPPLDKYTVSHIKTGVAVRRGLRLAEARRLYKHIEALDCDAKFDCLLDYYSDRMAQIIAGTVLDKIAGRK